MFILKKILLACLSLLLFPLKFIVPKGDVIIIQTYSPLIYCENTRHLYEYLSKNSPYGVYWVTEHPAIQDYIRQRGWRYLSHHGIKNILQKIWVTARARVVIDSGTQYYNFLGLIGRNAVKLTTLHGNGPKTVVITYDDVHQTVQEILNYHAFDYVNFNTPFCSFAIGRKMFRLPDSKRLAMGSPRCDVFFDAATVKNAYRQKPIAHRLKPDIKDDARIILYTPTWRTYEFDFPLYQLDGYTNEDFEAFLNLNNVYFFYSFHSLRGAQKLPPASEHIIHISHQNDPFYDTDLFMCETDLLVNDYSNTSTDYLLLGKPQIFVMPDYDQYEREQGFVEDYMPILPGPDVKTYSEFKQGILRALHDPQAHTSQYQKKSELYLSHYYDKENSSACGNFYACIKNLMEPHYVP